jgi:hypothetical protein
MDTAPAVENKALGRPSTYTPATAELIAMRLADGELLTDICRTPGMPSRQCVHRWRMKKPAFDALYMQARAIGMESMSDDMLAIADDDTLDVNRDGSANNVAVRRDGLRVDTRKFLLAKLAPKVYGDRSTVEHTGAVAHVVALPDRERMRRLASYLAEDEAAGITIDGQADTLPALPDSLPLPASSDAIEQPAIDEPREGRDEL